MPTFQGASLLAGAGATNNSAITNAITVSFVGAGTLVAPRYPVDLRQRHYRFRTDTSAVDASPSWGASEDTTYFPGAATFRLRMGLLNADQINAIAAQPWELYMSKNGAAYAPVTPSSTAGVQSSSSASSDPDETIVRVPRLTDLSVAPSWTYDNANIDLDFAGGRYYDSTLGAANGEVLLCHFEGANTSENIIDDCGRHTVSVGGTAYLSTAQSKFGGSSLFFDGSGGFIRFLDNQDDYNLGTTGDFTFELEYRPAVITGIQTLFSLAINQGNGSVNVRTNSSGRLITQSDTGNDIVGTTALTANNWYHVALVRRGGILRMFLNGTKEGNDFADTTNYYDNTGGAAQPRVGGSITLSDDSPLNGWIDEVRMLKGVAAFWDTFTLPTAPYTASATITPSSWLSCSRASIGYAKTATGVLALFDSNQLRITDVGLLIEDARTNYCLQSNAVDNGGYWDIGSHGCSVTPDVATAPDGTSADLVIATATGAFHFLPQTSITVAGLPAKVTWSVYAKAGAYNFGVLIAKTSSGANAYRILVDLTTGAAVAAVDGGSPTNVTSGVETLSNGWFRLWITMDAVTNADVLLGVNDTNTWHSFFGDGVSGINFWGVQVEVGSFPSSLITTTTTSATRAADAIFCAGAADTILSALPFSVVMDLTAIKSPAVVGGAMDFLLDNLGGNDVFYANGDANSDLRVESSHVGILLANFPGGQLFSTGVKCGQAMASGARSLVGGGGTVATDANSLALTSGQIKISYWQYLRRFTAWNSKLADATLQALTNPYTG
jgi:hypothetical protein